jgi:hypothetical protein
MNNNLTEIIAILAMPAALQKELMEKITSSLGEKPYTKGRYTVTQKTLPFYQGTSLVSIRNLASMPRITRSDITVSMDGTVSIKNDETVYDGLSVRPPRLR